jgi:hypothetical protein
MDRACTYVHEAVRILSGMVPVAVAHEIHL